MNKIVSGRTVRVKNGMYGPKHDLYSFIEYKMVTKEIVSK
jgi:hypothetical protein